MRYRQLIAGDDTFGQGSRNFLVNSPAAVAQAIATRLKLEVGEWYLDVTAGTPYQTKVLGYGSGASRDVAIRDRILATEGVVEITSYSSVVDTARKFSVRADVLTIYGTLVVEISQGDTPPIGEPGQLDWRIVGNVLLMVVG